MRSVAFAMALLVSTTVFAGTVTVQDDTNLFRALGQVESKAGDWPFDTRIVISDRAPNKSAFESQVSNQVVGPRTLAIGISPAHKFTVVRFGKGLHIPSDAWNSISSAGNTAFKVGEYGLGIINIGETVKGNMVQVIERPTYTTVTKSYTVEPEPAHPAWFVVPIGLVLFLALLIGLVIRKRAKERAQQERLRLAEEAADRIIAADLSRPVERITPSGNRYSYSESSAPIYPRNTYVAPVVQQPIVQPSPVVVHDSGNSLVTGMLLNEAIHSHHSHYEPEHHHHIEREVIRETVHETPSSSGGSSSSWSESSPSSGSSSSWNSSSDDSSGGSSSWSSSSSDSGSSSSWDSGSSSSSDSGSSGGGSDW